MLETYFFSVSFLKFRPARSGVGIVIIPGGADAADVDGRLFLAAGMGAWLPVVEVALALTA